MKTGSEYETIEHYLSCDISLVTKLRKREAVFPLFKYKCASHPLKVSLAVLKK